MPNVYRLHDTSQISGLRALDQKLNQLDAKLGKKVLVGAARVSMRQTVQKMRARAPVGKEWHNTYRGRPVAPGFLKRSIVLRARFDRRRGVATAIAGVKAEAFYGIMIDQGPYEVTRRRYKGTGRKGRPIKPYTLRRTPWFESSFIQDVPTIRKRFAEILRLQIEKVSK